MKKYFATAGFTFLMVVIATIYTSDIYAQSGQSGTSKIDSIRNSRLLALKQKLNLSSAQVDSLYALQEQYSTAMKLMMSSNPAPDERKLEHTRIRENHEKGMIRILTSDQFKQLQKIRADAALQKKVGQSGAQTEN